MEFLKTLALGTALLTPASCATTASAKKMYVEVFIKGSDIETRQNVVTRSLRNIIESEIESRTELGVAQIGQGHLTVLIPELVQIDTSANPALVTFKAHLERKSDGKMRDISGTCPETTLSICARAILNELAPMTH